MNVINNKITGSQGIVWGAIGGAVLAMILGFGFGFWTLQSTANEKVAAAVEKTQVALYTPVCVQRYTQAGADIRKKFADEDEWMRDSIIGKAGFATPNGYDEPISAVANECAEVLSNRLEKAAKEAEAKEG